MIRVAVAGSVDDGKSTLLGRLLNDTERVYVDEAEAVRRASGDQGVNLAFFTDGLVTERARGITMDVAWKHFTPPGGERLLLADVPGHVELIRNMATGASVADAAVLLVDVTRGLQPQTRRHLVMLSGLGVARVILCLNKMDEVHFSAARFDELCAGLATLTDALGLESERIPISARDGDNVVHRSARMPWFTGAPLIEHLVALSPRAEQPVAFVQLGTDASGWTSLHFSSEAFIAGTELHAATLGARVRIDEVSPLGAGRVRLSRAVARGELLTLQPVPISMDLRVQATWIAPRTVSAGERFQVLQHGRTTPALLTRVERRRSLETGQFEETSRLEPGDVGTLHLTLDTPTWLHGPMLLVDARGLTVAGLRPERLPSPQ